MSASLSTDMLSEGRAYSAMIIIIVIIVLKFNSQGFWGFGVLGFWGATAGLAGRGSGKDA